MTSASEGSSVLLALSTNLADIVEQIGGSVVAVNARRRRSSSGVYWRSGLIVTADHTVNRDEEISVTLPDDRTVTAALVGRDAGTDLALLQVEADLATAAIADTASLKVGQLVLAIARSSESGLNASMGVISALGESWRTWHGGRIDRYIRPSLSLYPGSSGGPLVNVEGQIVGINTTGPRHMALTIPASTINRVVNQLQQGGRVARGYLGLGMQPVQLPEALQRSLNLSNSGGVIVVSVEPGGPADTAGVLIGDIVTGLGDSAIGDVRDVHAMLDPEQVNQPLVARIIRAGALIDITITVGERPGRSC